MIETHYIKYPWRDFWTGMLLVTGSGGCVLIDTAFEDAADQVILPFLGGLGMGLDSIKLVVNTHSHGDHVEGNGKLRELTPAKFALHQLGDSRLAPDILLADGMILEMGDIRLEVIHAPGHSPDSVCILEPSTGTLFTGDSVQGRGTLNIGIALYSQPAVYRESMVKLRERCRRGDIRRLILGHPELPSNGVVEEPEALAFLDLSIQAVDDYAETMRNHPEADAARLRNLLLKDHGVTATPNWPELSYLTAEAHIRERQSASRA